MIVVRVELWSAITGDKTELARMHISNVGGDMKLRDYHAQTFRGRDTAALDKLTVQRETEIKRWPSQAVHIWNLVSRALSGMGYGE